MVIVCTTCNAENPAESVFCEECGIELDTAAVSAPSAATRPVFPAPSNPYQAPSSPREEPEHPQLPRCWSCGKEIGVAEGKEIHSAVHGMCKDCTGLFFWSML